LPVTGAAPVSLLRLVLEDDDLLAAKLLFDLCRHRGAGDDWRADLESAFTTDHEHAVKGDVCASLEGELFDRQAITNGYPVLFTTSLNDGVLFSARCGIGHDDTCSLSQ
jgi:hypothetical protein